MGVGKGVPDSETSAAGVSNSSISGETKALNAAIANNPKKTTKQPLRTFFTEAFLWCEMAITCHSNSTFA